MVNEGSVWQITSVHDGVRDNFGYRVDGDSTVNGIKHNKLTYLKLSDFRVNEDYLIISEYLYGLIREDTLEQKVYLRKNESTGFLFKEECMPLREKLILDFSLEIGDTMKTCITYLEEGLPCIIDTIYEVFVWGKVRKIKACTFYSEEEKLTEGVGFTDGLLIYGEHIPQTANWGLGLYKYCDSSIEGDCSLIQSPTSINEIHENLIRIYPNPVSSELNIDIEIRNLEQIELYDGYGRLIKKKEIRGMEKISLVMEELESGAYYIRIRDKKGNSINQSIIKL